MLGWPGEMDEKRTCSLLGLLVQTQIVRCRDRQTNRCREMQTDTEVVILICLWYTLTWLKVIITRPWQTDLHDWVAHMTVTDTWQTHTCMTVRETIAWLWQTYYCERNIWLWETFNCERHIWLWETLAWLYDNKRQIWLTETLDDCERHVQLRETDDCKTQSHDCERNTWLQETNDCEIHTWMLDTRWLDPWLVEGWINNYVRLTWQVEWNCLWIVSQTDGTMCLPGWRHQRSKSQALFWALLVGYLLHTKTMHNWR